MKGTASIEGDGLAVESRPRNPGAGVRFLVSSLISIEHAAELLRIVLPRWCCAVACAWLVSSNHGIACALRLGPTQPVTDFWG